MKIVKIGVKNFRLLKDFELDLEKDLSLVIGKNNSGKTSLLAVLDKFINDKSTAAGPFACDDFNIGFQKHFKTCVETNIFPGSVPGISLHLFIEYDDRDNLANLSSVIMDLDPENNMVVLAFDYTINEINFQKFKTQFDVYKLEQDERNDKRFEIKEGCAEEERELIQKERLDKEKLAFYNFFKSNQHLYFDRSKKSIEYDKTTRKPKEESFVNLKEENIKLEKIINLKIISARRDVSNRDNDKSLSLLSSKYYEKKEGGEVDSKEVKDFKNALSDTDEQFDIIYQRMFKAIVDKVGIFGGFTKGDSIIKIISSLRDRELLKGNTTVMYDHSDEHSLPENYNGLGYMNLIGMIFEIEVILTDFRKENRRNESAADLNLLFIEEPEAHTHPQMQYIFIRNIKEVLKHAALGEEGKQSFNLQTIITTHSSHITAECSFSDIKYFKKNGRDEIKAKNLVDLEAEYKKDGEEANYKFLKQYLTLHRAELFFADKAIFIEGDTERILLPAMMKKIDLEIPENPLLSQNISIVEVGAYSQVFEKFIHFIGIKGLIITDIDGAKVTKDEDGKETTGKCCMEDASITTNSSLKFYFSGKEDIGYFISLSHDYKTLRKHPKKKIWVANRKGNLRIVFQTMQKNEANEDYHARSFEEAFFHLNKAILEKPLVPFRSLTSKHLDKYLAGRIDTYEFTQKAISSKPTLAIEILLNSIPSYDGMDYGNWQIPYYIKNGIEWLKKN